ncbi:MAG: internal scaffolding protein [Microviridae sp.]|nr:MAG: internal scaffolding protein [Microviridae sp.]
MLLVMRVADGADADEVSHKSGLACRDKSLTKQEFLEETDINTIIRRFGLGYEPPVNQMVPLEGDFSDAPDFRTALDLVRGADEAFMTMSAEVRHRFHHDPVEFVEFFSDSKNREEGVKLGLVIPEAIVSPEKIVKVQVMPDTAVKPL